MDLDPRWYGQIERRMSRRRYEPRAVPVGLRERFSALCAGVSVEGHDVGVRACLVDDPQHVLFTGNIGSYGGVAGTPLALAFIAKATEDGAVSDAVQTEVGYVGEALILEATRLDLGTCWIAGSFNKDRAGLLVGLDVSEQVVAVTPLGYPTERQPTGERLVRSLVKASARHSVEKLAPGILDGAWPEWTVSAVQAVRRAPSGGNRQPWRFRPEGGALVMSRAEKLYWTAPIDFGIARLHVELGAAHEGVRGTWEPLPAPDVARFTPSD